MGLVRGDGLATAALLLLTTVDKHTVTRALFLLMAPVKYRVEQDLREAAEEMFRVPLDGHRHWGCGSHKAVSVDLLGENFLDRVVEHVMVFLLLSSHRI